MAARHPGSLPAELMRPPIWLFDLDNTLHNASYAIFPAVHANMNRYIAKVLQAQGLPCDESAVNTLRDNYWRRYGATMLGMVKHHQVSRADFLHHAHAFDDLASMVRAEPGLLRLLQRLPGRKILLTNAPRLYAADMMRELGLQRHIVHHIPVEKMHMHRFLRPKPSRQFLRKLLAQHGVPAGRCVLVEDTLANLKAAKRVGMRTVWLTQFLPNNKRPSQHPAYVDVKVKSIRKLAASLRQL